MLGVMHLSVALLAPVLPAGGLTLVDALRRADPNALAVSDDGGSLFLGEGTHVAVYDARDLPPRAETLEATLAVDAAVIALAPAGDRIFVAGGSQGLFVVDLPPPARAATAEAVRVDTVDGAVCMDVAVTSERVLALYSAARASELRAYARDSLVPLGRASLGPGAAYALALHPGTDALDVYVALGARGLARVRISSEAMQVAPGPDAEAFRRRSAGRGQTPRVRDVVVAGGCLYAAADELGVAQVDLGAAWSPATPVRFTPVLGEGRTSYVSHLATHSAGLAVGSNRAPVAVVDGGPYTSFGPMGSSGTVGDVPRGAFEPGVGEWLHLFAFGEERLEPWWEHRLAGGWRGLALAGSTLFEQHIGEGFLAFDVSQRPPAALGRYAPTGLAATDGVASTVLEGVLLMGTDPAGSKAAGLARVSAEGTLALLPGSAGVGRLGLFPGANWPGRERFTEWVVGGAGFHPELHRLRYRRTGTVHERWPIVLPEDHTGSRGREYFNAQLAGDLLLISRARSTHGVVAYSAPQLAALARTKPPGTKLEAPPRFTLETNRGAPVSTSGAWRCRTVARPEGGHLIVLAAGAENTPGHDRLGAPRLALYELDADGETTRPAGVLHAANARGNLIGVEVARLGERLLAVTADAAFGIQVFDLTLPFDPHQVAEWRAPLNPFDGHFDNALDVALDTPAPGRLVAYVALCRRGIVALDLSHPEDGAQELETLDTPGLAYGVLTAELHGKPYLVVGDHQAGLRLYRLPR